MKERLNYKIFHTVHCIIVKCVEVWSSPILCTSCYGEIKKPEDHWSCIAHLIAEDMLKSVVIEEKTFKHSPWAGADNPLGPKF